MSRNPFSLHATILIFFLIVTIHNTRVFLSVKGERSKKKKFTIISERRHKRDTSENSVHSFLCMQRVLAKYNNEQMTQRLLVWYKIQIRIQRI